MATIRIAAPDTASKDEVIELKALIQHPMETGYRSNARGENIPRDIITRFECRYNGEVVFASDFQPGMAANPILTFYTRATETGTLEFVWTDQDGQRWSQSHALTVA